MASIGQRMKELRTANKLSQAAFAKKIGFSRSYIGKVEQDITQPSRKMLESVRREFGVSVDWILSGDIPKPLIKPKYGRLRWILETTYDGENWDQIFELMEKEQFSLVERIVWLFTISTFLNLATEKPQYHKILYRYAPLVIEENVGEPCEESQRLIMENINDADALLELARFAFDYDQAGLFWYFFQFFDYLELWDFDIRSLKVKIKLFNRDCLTYDLLRLGIIKEPDLRNSEEGQE